MREYHHPAIRREDGATLMGVPAPSAVFEGSLADVSLLAGLLVDRFVCHLPLYHQHKRLADAGIMLSRSTLTHTVQCWKGLFAANPLCSDLDRAH